MASQNPMYPAVELRLGKIRAGLAKDLVGLAKLAGLALQCLDPLTFLGRRAIPDALVALGLPNPVVKGLRRAADLRRDRDNRRPFRSVIASVLRHHPHCPRTHFR